MCNNSLLGSREVPKKSQRVISYLYFWCGAQYLTVGKKFAHQKYTTGKKIAQNCLIYSPDIQTYSLTQTMRTC